MKPNIIIAIVSSLLIFLFVYTSVSKLGDFKTFSADMHNQPLPSALKNSLIWAVPFTEILAVGLLVFDKTRLAGLYVSFILMLTFTIYTAIVLLKFFDYVPCSCGGIIRSLGWGQHLIFNLSFTALCILGIWKYRVKIVVDKINTKT